LVVVSVIWKSGHARRKEGKVDTYDAVVIFGLYYCDVSLLLSHREWELTSNLGCEMLETRNGDKRTFDKDYSISIPSNRN
jgi:hypothetical protein